MRRGNAGDFWAAFGTPVFCVAKGDYYRAALLQKNRAFEEGVLWRQRGSPTRGIELWGFPAPLCELFPVTLRSTDSLREPACWWEKGGKNLYNQFLLIIV